MVGGMTHPDHEPDEGLDTSAEAPARKTPARKTPRGVDPLSTTHRRRLLRALNTAAQSGDVAAQAALIELSMGAERDAEISETLRCLRAGGEDA